MSERSDIPSTKYGPSVCCGVPLSLIEVDASLHVLSVEALFCVADKSEADGCAKDFGKLTNDIYDRTRLEQMMAITHMVFGIF
jgi:hypothetical protein